MWIHQHKIQAHCQLLYFPQNLNFITFLVLEFLKCFIYLFQKKVLISWAVINWSKIILCITMRDFSRRLLEIYVINNSYKCITSLNLRLFAFSITEYSQMARLLIFSPQQTLLLMLLKSFLAYVLSPMPYFGCICWVNGYLNWSFNDYFLIKEYNSLLRFLSYNKWVFVYP